jgi:hypothetical protein
VRGGVGGTIYASVAGSTHPDARQAEQGTYHSEIEGAAYSVISGRSLSSQARIPATVHVASPMVDGGTEPMFPSDKRFRVVHISQRAEEYGLYCFTTIGQGPCVCVGVNCVINHQGARVESIPPGTLLVLKGGNAAFLEPRIASERLSPEVVVSWVSLSKTLDSWNKHFALVDSVGLDQVEDAAAGIDAKPATHADIEAKEEFARQAHNFRTPLRKRKGAVFEETPTLGYSPYKRANIPMAEVFEAGSPEEMKQKVKFIFERMEDGLFDTSEVLLRLLVDYDTTVKTMALGISSLEFRANSFYKEFGTPSIGLAAEFTSPTAWGTIAGIASKVTEMDAHMLRPQELNKAIVASEDRSKAIFITMASISAVETRLNQGLSHHLAHNPIVRSLSDRVADAKTTLLESITLLHKRINVDSARIASLELATSCAPTSAPISYAPPSSHDDLANVEARVDKVEIELSHLIASTDERAIKFASMGFRRSEESASWLATHSPSNDFGIFVDAHMVLEHIHYTLHGTDALKRLESLYKLKIDTISQGLAITSFENTIPKMFSKSLDHKVLRDDASYFNMIPNFHDWDLKDGGWRDKIKEELVRFSMGHARTIDEIFERGSPGDTLARLCLVETVSWIEGFLSFIDGYQKELTLGKFGVKKGWSVTTRLAVRLLEEVASPRTGVIKMVKAGNSEQIARITFWATLQSLDIMAGIKANQYQNDPVVSSELVKFLAINTSFEVIDSLQKTVSDLETKLSAASKLIHISDKAAQSASNKSDEMKRMYDALTKRITTLENKK